jgi:2-keto-3-deoxy-L-rhamnonate aldolase RhmA
MGLELQFTNPEFISEVERIFAICKKHNVNVGIFCDTPESATYWKQKGVNFFWMCTDDEVFLAGMRSLIKPVSKL